MLFAVCIQLMAVFGCVRYASADFYTSMSDMEKLVDIETIVLANLEKHIAASELKLSSLKSLVNKYRQANTDASADMSAYVSNPINAFLLTKRLTSDLKSIGNLMSIDVGSTFLENVTDYPNTLKLPSDEDLNGAAVGLMRLQDTYQMDTSSIARGELNGVQYSCEMSANDCFEMGRQSYLNEDYYHTVLWMYEAMNRLSLNDSAQTTRTSKADILEYLAFSVYKQGNVNTALKMTNELLELQPGHERAAGNKIYYEDEILREAPAHVEDGPRGDNGSDELDMTNAFKKPDIAITPEKQLYEQLCRGDGYRSPAEQSRLLCRYVTNKSTFLKIGPLKLEEANLRPYIVVYHDVLYDNEIELIKQRAKPRFRRAAVINHETGKSDVSNDRISKSAWLSDKEHTYVERISRRVEDMTGLTTSTAEQLQVVNYGIGGQYEPHFDFAQVESSKAFPSIGAGNRIATVLFYMSDVEQGGATVFPNVNVTVKPRKGTAAFWYNLHASGQGDYQTKHAACPVLIGTKWIVTKWLHELGQDFRRPCELDNFDY